MTEPACPFAPDCTDPDHAMPPSRSGDVYFCPTSGEIEDATHGGFDTCCARPDLHRAVDSDDEPELDAHTLRALGINR